MKMFNSSLLCAGILIVGSLLSSCQKEPQVQEAGSAGYLTVKMTDAPADYDKVIVHILDVQVHSLVYDSGWISLEGVKPGYYNLLDLTNGVQTVIAEGDLPPGPVSQIKLVLGTDNTIETNGQVYVLQSSPVEQAGLLLNVSTAITLGAKAEVLIDFDAAKSIIDVGEGIYRLKPALGVIDAAISGSISGKVQPGQRVTITASQTADAGTTYSDPDGNFKLSGLLVGDYTVTIRPRTGSGFQQKLMFNIHVDAGKTTNLGSILM